MITVYSSAVEVLSAVVPKATAAIEQSNTYPSTISTLATLIPYMIVTHAILDQHPSTGDEEARRELVEAVAQFMKVIDVQISQVMDKFGKSETDLTVDLENIVDEFDVDVFETITGWIHAKATRTVH